MHIPTIPPSTDVQPLRDALARTDVILDAIFGFSFQPPVRAPFDVALPLGVEALKADRQMKIKSNGAACRVDQVYVTLAPRSPAASALFGLAAPPSAVHNGAANGNAAH